MSRKTFHVILDIDETLVLSQLEHPTTPGGSPRRRAASSYNLKPGKGDEPEFFDLKSNGKRVARVYLRPYLKNFLSGLFENATTVSIWSAGVTEYVNAIAKNLEEFVGHRFYFIWARSKCKPYLDENGKPVLDENGRPILVKPLINVYNSSEGRIVGMTDKNTVLIDDMELNKKIDPKHVHRIEEYIRLCRYSDLALPKILERIVKHININIPERTDKNNLLEYDEESDDDDLIDEVA